MLDIEHVVCAELGRELEPCAIAGALAGEDDRRRPRVLCAQHRAEPLLAGTDDQHGLPRPGVHVHCDPLNAIADRDRQRRELRRQVLGDFVEHGVPREMEVFGEPADKVRRIGRVDQPEATRLRAAEEIGVGAEAVFALQAPFALPARQVLLDHHPLSGFDLPHLARFRPHCGDRTDGLVAHRDRRPLVSRAVDFRLRASDPAGLDPQHAFVLAELRPGITAQLGPFGAGLDRDADVVGMIGHGTSFLCASDR